MKNKGTDFEKKVERCINSGALWFDKCDLKTSTHLIECKFTERKSFSITRKILDKLWEESLDSCKLPALIIGIKGEKDTYIINCQIQKEK